MRAVARRRKCGLSAGYGCDLAGARAAGWSRSVGRGDALRAKRLHLARCRLSRRMLRATRPGRMRAPELRAAVAPVFRRSPGWACAIVARCLRWSGPDRRPVDRMAWRDARSRRRRTRASLRHADPRKDRLRGRAARRGACLVRCHPGQPARRRKHRRAAAGARCRPHTTCSRIPHSSSAAVHPRSRLIQPRRRNATPTKRSTASDTTAIAATQRPALHFATMADPTMVE
jgi:hypothetical protein